VHDVAEHAHLALVGRLHAVQDLHQRRLARTVFSDQSHNFAAANGKLERTVPLRFSADETMDVGEDTGTPASEDYHVPFKFTGDLKKVMIELSDNKLTPAEELELRKAREAVGMGD